MSISQVTDKVLCAGLFEMQELWWLWAYQTPH